MILFNRDRVRLNRTRAFSNLSTYGFLRQEVQNHLFERLQDVRHPFTSILAYGLLRTSADPLFVSLPQTRTAHCIFGECSLPWVLPPKVFSLKGETEVYKNPHSSPSSDLLTSQSNHAGLSSDFFGAVVFEEDHSPFKNHSFDLIISCFSLHWQNDVVTTLKEFRRLLRPGGLIIAGFLGGDTLQEMRHSFMEADLSLTGGARARVAPMITLSDITALWFQAGFILPVIDREIFTASYESLKALCKDLKGMGEGNALNQAAQSADPSLFVHAEDFYLHHYASSDKRLKATFEAIFLCGWSPHPNS